MCKNKEKGKLGENIATEYLKENGYRIIERNFHCKKGEIDIIAEKSHEYIFIEVKARTNLKYGTPAESVTPIKEKHIKKATEYYLYKYNLENCYIRFDVIEIYINNNKVKINHIKQI